VNIIQMTHDMASVTCQYMCPKVKCQHEGTAGVLTFLLRDIPVYICMSHESIMRHLFCSITD